MRVGYGDAIGDAAAGADGVAANLDPAWLTGDPPWLSLFNRWLRDGIESRIPEPNAMVIATVGADRRPSTRTVLCKGADADGIVFFTGYDSDKARDIDANPYVSVTFPWIALERQVHIAGPVSPVSRRETENYWKKRPRGSQLGALASAQSRPIESRAALEAAAEAVAADVGGRDGDTPIPVPPRWGGYRVRPERVEFWQGRANRLHNRVRASVVDGDWQIIRLQP